jgi:hypothetical protein
VGGYPGICPPQFAAYELKCVKFTQERAELNDQITLLCQNINNLDDNNRLLWILNNENSIILKALCQNANHPISLNFYIIEEKMK